MIWQLHLNKNDDEFSPKTFLLVHLTFHSHVFIYCSQVFSDLRFTDSLLKRIYLFHKKVYLEKNEDTVFEEICNGGKGQSLLEWLTGGVYLRF